MDKIPESPTPLTHGWEGKYETIYQDKIPEPLIPITQFYEGHYWSKYQLYKNRKRLLPIPIPKNWTIYHLDSDNVIRKDGHLDYSTTGNSDIKMYHDRIAKEPYEWYVAKDNEQFSEEYRIPRSPSPSPSPIYRSPRSPSQEKKEESAGKKIKKFMKQHKGSIANKRRGGNKSRTRRGTRRRNRRGTRRK